jgi:hypothetical protein
MAPRSTHRTAVLTVTGLLVTALMYSAAYRDDPPAHAQAHATATPTHLPTNTAMPSMTATSTATVTSTATQTATPLSTAITTPTAAPTATGTLSSGSGTCAVHDPNAWHGAVGPNGCTYGHEHGSQPPGWVMSSPWPLTFTGAFNTSAKENAQSPSDAMPDMTGKHTAMKAFLGPVGTGQGGGQFFLRYHAASNVLDRMARFHSFELWYRDAQGGISHVDAWINSGVPTRFGDGQAGAGGRRNVCSNEVDIRPEVEVVTSLLGFRTCNPTEHWYFYPVGIPSGAPGMELPTISVLVDATTLDFANEAANTSMTTWKRTGSLGVSREGSVIWPPRGGDFPAPSGSFWTTQFGEYVTGPSDPKCSAQTVFPARPTATINPFDVQESYANVCLQQTISPTAPGFIEQVAQPGQDFPSQGVRLPN